MKAAHATSCWPRKETVNSAFLTRTAAAITADEVAYGCEPMTILRGRRAFKNFSVPSVPDEFIYYLIKKVLKQSIDASQMRRLHGLYQRAPQDCHTWLHRFWSTQTANALERALGQRGRLLVCIKSCAAAFRARGVGPVGTGY